MPKNNHFSHIVSVFHGRHLPEGEMLLAGYAVLIETYQLQVPLPEWLCAISEKHKKYAAHDWRVFSPRHAPDDSLYGHLVFALKYEGVNLAMLNALFKKLGADEMIKLVSLEPTGSYSRRLWFLYEWLQETSLAIPDAGRGDWVDVLDSDLQYPGPARESKRHRVTNNLPGVPAFCPIIRRTEKLDQFIALNLREHALKTLGEIHPDVLLRAAAFMLLKDSKASFAIEGEVPPQSRAERWGQAIGQAGMHALSHDEFIRLQQIIISDFRFIHLGYRNEGGFVGEHERGTGMPMPDHISAKPGDLFSLIDGLIATDELLKENGIDPVLAAAAIAFGFVFIHPFEDGNGRIHRYLIHHVLAEKTFSPTNIVFPVSSVIFQRITEYRQVLESYSQPCLQFINWRPTEKGNVEVLNDTVDLYRYFDATRQAEFLYDCVRETVEKTLPEEVEYLQKYDEMKYFVNNYIEMPDRLVDLLIRFLQQNKGVLSNRARQKEFNLLTEEEAATLEKKFAEIFGE